VSAADSTFLAIAQAAVDAGMVEARNAGINVAVVVLDRSFTLAAAQRMDAAYPTTVPVAQAKAHTALNFRSATADLVARISAENRRALQTLRNELLFVGGGVPLVRHGDLIGAVGVSGGSEDDDIRCAEAAARAIAAGLAPV
jgi:uncharacterized protein GlcG (DUF336 family)